MTEMYSTYGFNNPNIGLISGNYITNVSGMLPTSINGYDTISGNIIDMSGYPSVYDRYEIRATDICNNCKTRPAKVIWTDSSMSMIHGMYSKWCNHCCLKEQIKTCKEQAARLPELEKEYNELLKNDI